MFKQCCKLIEQNETDEWELCDDTFIKTLNLEFASAMGSSNVDSPVRY